MNRKVKTPDCGSIGYVTNKRPIWAEGKSYYDSYTFVKLSENRIVAYTNDESLIPIEENKVLLEPLQISKEQSNKVFVNKRFFRNKKAPITIERG